MRPFSERASQAASYHQQAMERVAATPEPQGQKFPNGSRVKVADDLGPHMSHFTGKGKTATVRYTYAHAYGGNNVKDYCLDIDGEGESAWYHESQLTAI